MDAVAAIGVVTFVEVNDSNESRAGKVADQAGRWVTVQVDNHGRAVSEVVKDLGCDRHTVMGPVVRRGRALTDDPNRIGTTVAVGLDYVLFCQLGRFRHCMWSIQIVDGACGQLLDVVLGRAAASTCAWFAAWRERR